MNQNAEHIASLLKLHLSGDISSRELDILQAWAKDNPRRMELLKDYGDTEAIAAILEEYYTYNNDSVAEKLHNEFPGMLFSETAPEAGPVVKTPVRRIHLLRKWSRVAAAILVTGIGTYFWYAGNKHTKPAATAEQTMDLPPGREGAILTLADGSQVSLDTVRNATIALQGGATAKVVNGALVYEGIGSELVYNTISTPKGRQFKVTLPDGTQVWLNAASSIRYPVTFSGAEERRVYVSGEVFMDVAKNRAQPFIAGVNEGTEVLMLGTQLNINAYPEQKISYTTLLEGAVEVKHGLVTERLRPGQQALAGDGIQVLSNVDVDRAVAWKNGAFSFENVTLEEAMQQIERWYDIEVVIEKGVPRDAPFYGKISRKVSLQALLKLMEGTDLNFRLESDRKLIITNIRE